MPNWPVPAKTYKQREYCLNNGKYALLSTAPLIPGISLSFSLTQIFKRVEASRAEVGIAGTAFGVIGVIIGSGIIYYPGYRTQKSIIRALEAIVKTAPVFSKSLDLTMLFAKHINPRHEMSTTALLPFPVAVSTFFFMHEFSSAIRKGIPTLSQRYPHFLVSLDVANQFLYYWGMCQLAAFGFTASEKRYNDPDFQLIPALPALLATTGRYFSAAELFHFLVLHACLIGFMYRFIVEFDKSGVGNIDTANQVVWIVSTVLSVGIMGARSDKFLYAYAKAPYLVPCAHPMKLQVQWPQDPDLQNPPVMEYSLDAEEAALEDNGDDSFCSKVLTFCFRRKPPRDDQYSQLRDPLLSNDTEILSITGKKMSRALVN